MSCPVPVQVVCIHCLADGWKLKLWTIMMQGGDVTEINRSAISAVKAKQASMGSSPLLKLLQVLLPLLIILAAIFLPKYVL